MTEPTPRGAGRALALCTFAFACAVIVWLFNGVLVTFLVEQGAVGLRRSELGLLIGAPVFTGAVLRLPAGILADRYGGRIVITVSLLLGAAGALLESLASGLFGFLGAGLLLGVAGASFAPGAAYASSWYPKEKQGTALGIFGAGNLGAAVTSVLTPFLLRSLTSHGEKLDGWRNVPRLYAAGLAVVAVLFFLLSPRQAARKAGPPRGLIESLTPLRTLRVWRFGFYYFVLYGGFVGLSQWLIPYYVNLYAVSLTTAGALTAAFSLPPNVTRALGGWLSDRLGARRVMNYAFIGAAIGFVLLSVPRMDIQIPGQSLFAEADGVVEEVGKDYLVVNGTRLTLEAEPPPKLQPLPVMVWPKSNHWHTPVVAVGEPVVKRQILAKGVTHVYFQANLNIFIGIIVIVGGLMGVGMAGVYRHIPEYFPNDVGGVSGIISMIGALGGFVGPVAFGALLSSTGLWITCWMLMAVMCLISLAWMHQVIRRMLARAAPELQHRFEEVPSSSIVDQHAVECRVHGLQAVVSVTHADDGADRCRLRQLVDALDTIECRPREPERPA